MNKIVKISKENLHYLKTLVESESEKFKEVKKCVKNRNIEKESKILNSLNRQLSV